MNNKGLMMKLKGIELKGTYRVEFGDLWLDVYDEKDNRIYFENSDGNWFKEEFDEKGNVIYFENGRGYIDYKRTKELTIEEIEKLLGYKIKIKGENK